MTTGTSVEIDARVLVLAPTGSDATLAAALVEEAGFQAAPCDDAVDACDKVTEGAGVLVIAEEALVGAPTGPLVACLERQPPWSDLPIVVLTMRSDDGSTNAEILRIFDFAGHVVLLERPFTPAAFAVTIEMALRARRKQYRVREVLDVEQDARAAAERASRMKDEFLATVSHELRNPLNAILGWARLLRTDSLPEKDRASALSIIERNARAQAELIEDLLDMSRIASGRMRLDVKTVPVAEFVRAAIETVRPAADAKDIRLEARLDDSAGSVSGDPTRLQQVIWNLLSNAVKFTPRGGRVEIDARRAGSSVEIVVRDDGEGIRPSFLPHVFDAFRQFDGSITRASRGLGIGLSIVRRLVEMHGGVVSAKSDGEGRGSTFTVRLPTGAFALAPRKASPAPSPGKARAPLEAAAVSLAGLHVLAVDDEEDSRELLSRVLTVGGAEVRSCASAAEALAALETFRADVVLSDIAMPEMDGYELLRRARRNGLDAPAIAITAFARAEDRTRALGAGYSEHITKPIDASELVAVVARAAARRG